MAETIRVLFIGDIIGSPGLMAFQKWIPKLREQHNIDAVVVNGENAVKNGMGITPRIVDFLKLHGASVITTGNHMWDQKEVYASLNERDDIIRPANYPPGTPGKGHTFFQVRGHSVAMINLHGRVFVRDILDCPFRAVDGLLTYIKTRTKLIFVDFHADATSEKRTMGMYLDGRVSGVFGTHTHVQTADEFIQPGGTGYMTDLGGSGPQNSVLGMEFAGMLPHFLVHRKMGKIAVEQKGPYLLCGLWMEVDVATGKTVRLERIRVVDDVLHEQSSSHIPG